MSTPVYEPREDSFLIANAAKKIVKGKILEVGFGSGYVLNELSKNDNVKECIGVDINPLAVEHAKKYNQNEKTSYIESDLFQKVDDTFDFILCNPPYLPDDGFEDPALFGGKKGYEFIERLLTQVESYLADNGSLILLFSNLSKKDMVERIIERNFFEFRQLTEKGVGNFETLYVYEIKKKESLWN
ncbi:hypothetical protein BVX95_00975 [archaeon D22]|nr:hypothetical protein BVX95_00975 [archaeon D22]